MKSFILALLIGPVTLLSQRTTVAVLDFDAAGISKVEAIALSNRLRNELFRLGIFSVVERGMMDDILREQDFQQSGCTSNECLVEVGMLLGAELMIGGSISKVGRTFTVSARLVNVASGELMRATDYDHQGPVDQLLSFGIATIARNLSGLDESFVLSQKLRGSYPTSSPISVGHPHTIIDSKILASANFTSTEFGIAAYIGVLKEINVLGLTIKPTFVIGGTDRYTETKSKYFDEVVKYAGIATRTVISGSPGGGLLHLGIGFGSGYYTLSDDVDTSLEYTSPIYWGGWSYPFHIEGDVYVTFGLRYFVTNKIGGITSTSVGIAF